MLTKLNFLKIKISRNLTQNTISQQFNHALQKTFILRQSKRHKPLNAYCNCRSTSILLIVAVRVSIILKVPSFLGSHTKTF